MTIHLPAILMFTRGTRVLTHCHISIYWWRILLWSFTGGPWAAGQRRRNHRLPQLGQAMPCLAHAQQMEFLKSWRIHNQWFLIGKTFKNCFSWVFHKTVMLKKWENQWFWGTTFFWNPQMMGKPTGGCGKYGIFTTQMKVSQTPGWMSKHQHSSFNLCPWVLWLDTG